MKPRCLLLFLLVLHHLATCRVSTTMAQVLFIEALPEEGILLDKGWKFQPGDNPAWADPGFNDAQWQPINPTEDIKNLPQLWQNNIVWFRLHLSVDSLVRQQSLVLYGHQAGATEIYLNGRLIKRLGVVSSKPEEVQAHKLPLGLMIPLPLSGGADQVLAVRFALQKNLPYLQYGGIDNPAWMMKVSGINEAVSYMKAEDDSPLEFFRTGAFLILAVLHFAFFWFYPAQRANLYFFLYTLFSALWTSMYILAFKVYQQDVTAYLILFVYASLSLSYIFYLRALYIIFNKHRGIYFWAITTALLVFTPLALWLYHQTYSLLTSIMLLIPLETMRVSLLALQRKQRGAKIVAGGAISFFVLYLIFEAMANGYIPAGSNFIIGDFMWNISALSFPVSISILLALEFAFTSRTLEAKLVEVQQLSEKTLAQEVEKQQILQSQNETLERQVIERTTEVVAQKEELQAALENLKATQSQLVQKEKMASLGELTAGIAHEIQNPLNFVNNFSEVSSELVEELKQETIADHKEEVLTIVADLKQNLERIHQHGQRADGIVKNMLQHSRASSGEKQLTDINTLADEYMRLSYYGFRALEKEFTCTLSTSFEPKLKKVEVVPQDIARVLLNLFNNAFYAVQQKQKLVHAGANGEERAYMPKVSVSSRKSQSQVEIQVRDNGVGMPESVKHKIFQPFFTTKPAGQGTGLGLSLSYDIITKGHGGEMQVESKEGEYSEFSIRLPYTTTFNKQPIVL